MKFLNLSIAGIAMLMLFSCSKSDSNVEPNPSDKLHTVKFTVDGFTQSYKPIDTKSATTTSTASSPINEILYILLDKDQLPIDTLKRPVSGNSSSINLKLLNGNYTLRAIGYNNSNLGNLYTKYERVATVFQPKEIFKIKDYDISDIFTLNTEFQVSKDSTYKSQTLKRISSKLELNILDKIPAQAAYIEISTISSNHFYGASKDLKNNITLTYNTSYVSNVIDITSLASLTNQTISTNVLTDNQTYTAPAERTTPVKINVLNSTGAVIISKEILNVKLMPNTITRLSGKLFEDLNSEKKGNFAVTINQNFNTNIITQTF
ncbi:hypothetical protein PZ892_00685 [Sphingobacterium sp. WM]|uniref:hypothetical protein n=1 Tax=Sphingobacterium sp. WM TaxID=3031802 RepID=UPI00240DE775|nr:hypothetical protein [Sphingobacterium sp. WM]WFB63735.1 hypothetical protein PZ892_00685 [Sphingobacterium sp. WM]